jgi:hypothetical protein
MTGPVLADRSVVPGDGRPLEPVAPGQDRGLQLQIAAPHRQAQRERFNLDAGLGQFNDVPDRQVSNPEASLGRRHQQVLLGQAGQRLPDDDGLADPERVGEFNHLQLLAGVEDPLSKPDRSWSYTCSVRVTGASESSPSHSIGIWLR